MDLLSFRACHRQGRIDKGEPGSFQPTSPSEKTSTSIGGILGTDTFMAMSGKGENYAWITQERAHFASGTMPEFYCWRNLATARRSRCGYFELDRSRQFYQLARRMVSSAGVVNASYKSDDPEAESAQAKMEADMFRAELEYRQAYARLKTLTGAR